MKALGIDFGGSRIGLATGDEDSGIVTPRGTLAASGTLETDAKAIVSCAEEHGAEVIVLGIPYDPQGKLTRMMRITQQLGARMRHQGANVEFVDETLTTQASESELKSQGLTGSQVKKHADAEAACRILERWFAERDERS